MRTISLIIVGTFILSTIAGAQPATQTQIDAAETVLDNQGPEGEDVLQGSWAEKNEIHRLFFRTDETMRYEFGNRNGNTCFQDYQVLYDPLDPADASGTTGFYTGDGPVTFDVGETSNDFLLSRIQGTLWIKEGGAPDVEVHLLDDGTEIPGARMVIPFDALVSDSPDTPIETAYKEAAPYVPGALTTPYSYFAEMNPPVTISQGTNLQVRVQVVNTGFTVDPVGVNTGVDAESVGFEYGACSIDSFIELFGNTARVNAWTEDLSGVVTTAFPLAQDAPSEDRTIVARIAHVNALGDFGAGDDPIQEHTSTLRIIDEDGNDRTGISDIRINTRTIKAVAPGMQFVEYVVQYPDDLLNADGDPYDGKLTLRFGGNDQNWRHEIDVAIGGAQVELDLAEFEDATKTILVGEETTFLMTLRNGGLVRDDVVITAAELNGWGVEALVDSVGLSPGETRTFPVTIEPPANAVAGDFQAFNIEAISSRSGQTDVETVTVILTDLETDGVDILASQLETIKLSASQTQSVGLTVKNLGNSAEPFTITTSGAPLGWKAKVSPSSMELGAKSQGGTLLSVTAPADAQQGDTFALTVTVRSIEDNTIRDILVLPFEVFFREDFTLEVAHGAAGGVFQNHITTLADMQVFPDTGSIVPAPGIHVLRDEGGDGDSRDSCGTRVSAPVAGRIDPGCSDTNRVGPWDGIGDPDSDYDQSTLYRLVLTNHGDRADQIRINPALVFDNAWESRDRDECEEDSGGTDDVPDGWRFRYWEGGTAEPADLPGRGANPHDERSAGGFGTDRISTNIKTIDLDAGETKYLWVEMGWVPVARLDDSDQGGTDCPGTDQVPGDGGRESPPTKNMVVRFTAESLRDLTKVQDLYLRAHLERNIAQARDASQTYEDQFNNVHIGHDTASYSNEDGIGLSNILLAQGSESERTTKFHLRAVNGGNEMDTIRIELPLETGQFEYVIPSVDVDDRQAYANSAVGAGTPQAAGCNDLTDKRIMDCTLGAFDEVQFEVHVTAKEGQVPTGLVHNFVVSATSQDSVSKAGGIATSSVPLSLLATGTHAFAITQPVVADGIHDVDVTPGGTIKVPFTIANQGTADDNYQVDLLEMPPADSGWDGIFGFNSPQFLAAEKSHHGFLTIIAPDDAVAGDTETFRVRVQSLNGVDVPARTLRIQANVIAAPTGLEVIADPPEVIAFPGTTVDMTFQATRTSGLATNVEFRVDTTQLPTGWSVADATETVDYDATGKASHTFTFSVPSSAIGSSRVPIFVTGTDSSNNEASGQGVISLSSDAFGVRLSSPEDFDAEEISAQVVSGSTVSIPVRVQNLGGGIDQIGLDTEPLPDGWTVAFAEGKPDPATFQPFEARTVLITVRAPEGLAPGEGRDIVLKATSVSDASRTDTIVLDVRTGDSVLLVQTPNTPTRFLAPLESTTYAYSVQNNGTVRDEVTFSAGLSAAYEDLVPITFSPESANLGPGESQAVTAKVTIPESFLPNSVIPIKLEATSDGPLLNAFGEAAVSVRVLDHRVLDIDNDGNPEYAIDRNRDGSDGFEDFTDPKTSGKRSVSLDMASFLTQEGRDGHMVIVNDNGTDVPVFTFFFDLTGDGRVDHFIDEDQDNIADWFWDPTTGARDALDVTFDVTGDGVREHFVDVNSDGLLDVWYDLTTGLVGDLIKVDVDGDDAVDFVVDLNRNGVHDDEEPVLFGKDGKITKVTQVIDVNGDGRGDLVVDEDGDGIPDYFVPAGKTRGVPIVLEDVNGDGVEDWTYDANNDGKRDSYYDPVTGKTGSIDTQSEFVSGLADYWYVPTLFALVTVLFVVLVVVTRR